MKNHVRRLLAAILVLAACGGKALAEGATNATILNLQVSTNETKTVSLALGQQATEVISICQPAKFYCDDDPWVSYPAAGGGIYVLFFAPSETQGKPDLTHGTLAAVAKYAPERPGGSIHGKPGVFLLPARKQGQACPWGYLVGKGSPLKPGGGDVQ